MQELAGLALLAQAPQPMLADERVEGVAEATVLLCSAIGGGDVSVGAAGSEGAVAIGVGPAYWTVGGEAVEIGALEKWGEGECRGRLGGRFGEQLLRQHRGCCRGGRGRHRGLRVVDGGWWALCFDPLVNLLG